MRVLLIGGPRWYSTLAVTLLATTALVALASPSVSGRNTMSAAAKVDSARSGFQQRQIRVTVHGNVVSVSTRVASKHTHRVAYAGVCSRRAGARWQPFVTRKNFTLKKAGTTVSGSRRVSPGQYSYRSCVRHVGVLTVFGTSRAAAVRTPVKGGASATPNASAAASAPAGSHSTGSAAAPGAGSGPQPPATQQPPANAITPEQFGAVGDGQADDTTAVQRALDAVPAGGTLWLADGKTYAHSAVLKARVAGEKIAGPGTVLATNQQYSSFWIAANDVTVDGPTFDVASTSKRWDAYEQMGVRIAGVTGTVLSNITVEHSAAAGIYVGQGSNGAVSSNFLLDHVTVQNTRADGIHMTGGSHDGTVRSPTVSNTGDDAIAVVSYTQDGVICNHIEVDSPQVLSTAGGRGLTVVGGQYITYSDIDVSRTAAAGVYLANEGAPFDTASTSHVTVDGGTITGANTNANIGHGAILLYSSQSGHTVSDVTVENLTIRNTPTTAPWEVGIRADSGSVSDVALAHFAIYTGRTPFAANVPRSAYTITDWTVNGAAYSAP